MSDDLFRGAVLRPATRWLAQSCTIVGATNSTNDDARALAASGVAHGHAIVADHQRAGRGRRGRIWISPPGCNLYVSFVLRPPPHASAGSLALLPLAAGLGVRDALAEKLGTERVTVKWPNDVRIDARKVAGILAESSVRSDGVAWCILGIGINVNGRDLDADIADLATTIERATLRQHDRIELLHALCVRLERRLETLWSSGAGPIVEDLSRCCDTLGRRITSDLVDGIAREVLADGSLRVERADGSSATVNSGEVVIVG